MKKTMISLLISLNFFSVSALAEGLDNQLPKLSPQPSKEMLDPLSYPATYIADSSNSYRDGDSLVCEVSGLKNGETFDCEGAIYQSTEDMQGSLQIISSKLTDEEIEFLKKNNKEVRNITLSLFNAVPDNGTYRVGNCSLS